MTMTYVNHRGTENTKYARRSFSVTSSRRAGTRDLDLCAFSVIFVSLWLCTWTRFAMSRPIIIGAGHNGLVCAAYLAKAGLRPLVLEARDEVGGCAVTHELAPGVRVPALTHTVALRADVVRDLGLDAQGLHLMHARGVRVRAHGDGRALVLPRDTGRRRARAGAVVGARCRAMAGLCRDDTGADTGDGRGAGPGASVDRRAVAGRAVGTAAGGTQATWPGAPGLYDLLRWGPMPIGDLAAEWFETPALRAAICARGVFGMQAGPRSAGTTASWLLQAAQEGHPTGAMTVVGGGPGALAAALAVAATGAGAEIRRTARGRAASRSTTPACARSCSHRVSASRQARSSPAPIHSTRSCSSSIRSTCSRRSASRSSTIRANGVVAKVNLVVTGLPAVAGLDAAGDAGRSRPCRDDCWSATSPTSSRSAFDCTKYGRMSDRPWLEVTVPSLTDSTLAPAGQHVLSIYAQYAPYRLREGDWESQPRGAGRPGGRAAGRR